MIHSPPPQYVLDNLLIGFNDVVAAWVLERIPEMAGDSFGPCSGIGILRDGKIAGGVVYNHYRPHPDGGDIAANIALDPSARVTRSMWRQLFAYPFDQLGCRRITTFAIRSNKKARRFNKRIGFRLEGVRREGHGATDIFTFGMLRSECRFWSPT